MTVAASRIVPLGVSGTRIRRLAKEGTWILAGQIAWMCGGLALVRVLTEYLDQLQYGRLALGLTLAGFVNQAVIGGIASGIARFYSIAAEKQDLRGYLRASWRLLGLATLVVAALGLAVVAGLVCLGYSHWIGLVGASLAFAVTSGLNSTLSGIQNAARQRGIVAVHGALDAWLKILLAVAAVLLLGTSGTFVVIGYACSSVLVTASQLVFLRRTIPAQLTPVGDCSPWVHQIWGYAWPFSVWGIFTWMQQVSDRWALATFASTEDVGRYAVLFQLGYGTVAIATGLALNFLAPILYSRSGDAANDARNNHVHRLSWLLTYVSLAMTLTGFAAAFAVHELCFRVLASAQFREISYLLPWVVLAGGLFGTSQMLELKLMSDLKSTTLVPAKIGTAILGLTFNACGAALAGIPGVVSSLCAFSIVHLVWMICLTRTATRS